MVVLAERARRLVPLPPVRRRSRRGRTRPAAGLPSSDHGPRIDLVFVCSACAAETPRWMGQCPGCGEWNTLNEETRGAAAGARPRRQARRGGRSRCGCRGRGADVRAAEDRDRRAGPDPRRRPRARLAGADRRLARHRQVDADVDGARATSRARGRRTLYVSGEESAAQIRLRAERLPGRGAAGAGAGRDRPGHGAGDAGGRAARGVRDRLGADAARGRSERRGGVASGRCARSPTGSRGWPRRAGSRCCSSAT